MRAFFKASGEKKIFFIPFVFFLLILISEVIAILILNSGLIVYTTDDAYIHLALAENIIKGHYGVNLLENSSPSSSILWPFTLAPFANLDAGYLTPLVINILSSICSIIIFFLVLKQIFFTETSDNPKFNKTAILFLILLIIGTNLIGSLFSGMEHSLQIFLTLLNIYGLIIFTENKNIPKWLLPIIITAPLIRYENLALSFSSLVFLYLMGNKKRAVLSFIVIIIMAGSFSFFLLNLGLKALPLSVLQKSSVISSGGLYPVIENLKENLLSPRGSFLLLGFFILLVTAVKSKRDKSQRLLAACFALSVLAHLVLGKHGRYIVYLWAGSLLFFLFLYKDWITTIVNRFGFTKTAVFFSLVTILVSYYYILSIVTIPIGSNNIYEQHYQMHRFASDYYKKPVAVNDLGYVSYNNDNYVLDLVGLASEEALNYQLKGKSSEWIDTLSGKYNVELAMIYDDWFEKIPENWYKAAELHLGKMKMSASRERVSFYLLDKRKKNDMIKLLRKFKDTLPDKVFLDITE